MTAVLTVGGTVAVFESGRRRHRRSPVDQRDRDFQRGYGRAVVGRGIGVLRGRLCDERPRAGSSRRAIERVARALADPRHAHRDGIVRSRDCHADGRRTLCLAVAVAHGDGVEPRSGAEVGPRRGRGIDVVERRRIEHTWIARLGVRQARVLTRDQLGPVHRKPERLACGDVLADLPGDEVGARAAQERVIVGVVDPAERIAVDGAGGSAERVPERIARMRLEVLEMAAGVVGEVEAEVIGLRPRKRLGEVGGRHAARHERVVVVGVRGRRPRRRRPGTGRRPEPRSSCASSRGRRRA